MCPTTISRDLIEAIETHITPTIGDKDLLTKLVSTSRSASKREIARAALYASTDAFRRDVMVTKRLFDFAMSVRRSA
jgi:hypothetical protein